MTSDDRYAYVSDETTGALSVFDLTRALSAGFDAPGVAVGIVDLAPRAVGVALSPDGLRAYATTLGAYGDHGLLWAIDTARAERRGSKGAVLARARAGCQPVRVAVSPDAREIFVTAFSPTPCWRSAPDLCWTTRPQALRANVPVGSEPVELALVDHGRLALVANSNRGLVRGSTGRNAPQTVGVVDIAAALAHRPALIGELPAGRFPRDLNLDSGTGPVLLANFNSETIEVFHQPSSR